MAMLWRHRHAHVPTSEPVFETIQVPETTLPAIAAAIEESLTETEATSEDAE